MHFSIIAIQIQKIILIDYRTLFYKQTRSLITQHAQPAAPDLIVSRRKRALQMNDEAYWPKGGGEGDNRGQDGPMASPTQVTWVSASSGRWWRTEKPGVLQSMGSQRLGHDLRTEQQMNFGGQQPSSSWRSVNDPEIMIWQVCERPNQLHVHNHTEWFRFQQLQITHWEQDLWPTVEVRQDWKLLGMDRGEMLQCWRHGADWKEEGCYCMQPHLKAT